MSREEAEHAMQSGVALAEEAASRFHVAGVGEMGIGNTTAASALLCAFTGIPPRDAVGRGTGLDDRGLERKVGVVAHALALHRPDPADPVNVLSALSGFEIAMMAGFLLGAAQRRLPVVVDGFISGSAALAAQAVAPAIGQYLFFSHQSAEPGHTGMLAALGAEPILSLGLCGWGREPARRSPSASWKRPCGCTRRWRPFPAWVPRQSNCTALRTVVGNVTRASCCAGSQCGLPMITIL